MQDDLFRVDTLLDVKCRELAQSLIDLEGVVYRSSRQGHHTQWADGELKSIQERLDTVEKLETEAWVLTARVEGNAARTARASRWSLWYQDIQKKMQTIKRETWQGREGAHSVPAPSNSAPASCSHRGGYVEKVKLPTYSGNIEDYAEFKSQFQQLCKGEGYSSVIELAQLRPKLPREAAAAIVGITSPEKVWERLDELYGNREMSVITALKRLRNFKSSKTPAHEQVIELVTAVQRCQAVMEGLQARV